LQDGRRRSQVGDNPDGSDSGILLCPNMCEVVRTLWAYVRTHGRSVSSHVENVFAACEHS